MQDYQWYGAKRIKSNFAMRGIVEQGFGASQLLLKVLISSIKTGFDSIFVNLPYIRFRYKRRSNQIFQIFILVF